jgi:helix-turn-helix protein
VWTLQTLHVRVHDVAAESDPLAAFRAELCARREREGLTYNEAARLVRPKFSGQRWRELEQQSNTFARRPTIIKLARALGWDPAQALALAGERTLAPAAPRPAPDDPRQELRALVDDLTDIQVLALLYIARVMKDPEAAMPQAIIDNVPHEQRDEGTPS